MYLREAELKPLFIFHSIFFEYFPALSKSRSHAETYTNINANTHTVQLDSHCMALVFRSSTHSLVLPFISSLLRAETQSRLIISTRSPDPTLHSQNWSSPCPFIHAHPIGNWSPVQSAENGKAVFIPHQDPGNTGFCGESRQES